METQDIMKIVVCLLTAGLSIWGIIKSEEEKTKMLEGTSEEELEHWMGDNGLGVDSHTDIKEHTQ